MVDEWKAILSPVEDISAALRLRRVVDLLGEPTDLPANAEGIEAIYRDPHGGYVVVHTARPTAREHGVHSAGKRIRRTWLASSMRRHY